MPTQDLSLSNMQASEAQGSSVEEFLREQYGQAGIDALRFFSEYGLKAAVEHFVNAGAVQMLFHRPEEISQFTASHALEVASSKGYSGIVEILLNEGTEVPQQAVKNAISGDFRTVVQLLVDKELPQHVIEDGNLEIVRTLDLRQPQIDESAEIAARFGSLEILRALVEEKGASVGENALEIAARFGHLEVVRYLVEEQEVEITRKVLKSAKDHMDIIYFLCYYLLNLTNKR